MHLLYLANSYFYNCKLSPCILRQHRDLQNLKKNKYIVITKPNKGNGIVILYRKLYNNSIEKIILDISEGLYKITDLIHNQSKSKTWKKTFWLNVIW